MAAEDRVVELPPPVGTQLDRVLESVDELLRSDLVAAYLHGSAVAGGLRRHSDLDVLVVMGRRLSEGERGRLVDLLRPLSRRGSRPTDWRPLELSIVALADVVPWRYPARLDFQYGEWLQEEFDRGVYEPSAQAHADLAIVLATVRENGIAVRGAEARAVLPNVPVGDVAHAMIDGLDPLMADLESDTTNVILTLARIWSTLQDGGFRSKDAAADWAAERLGRDYRFPLERARDIYLGQAENWTGATPDVAVAAKELVRRIRATETVG